MYSLWREFESPQMQLRLLVSISMIVFECLVAIWAATSRRHWFWRALGVWAALMLMVPIRAWEPAWLFGLSSLLIIGLLQARRWFNRRAPSEEEQTARYRFSLRDLFLLVLIIGLFLPGILEVLRHYRPTNWLGWLASSISVALLAVASYACARTPRRWLDLGLLGFALFELVVAVWLDYPTYFMNYSVLAVIAALAALLAYAMAFDRWHWLAMFALVCLMPLCAASMYQTGHWTRWPIEIGSTATQQIAALIIIEAALVLAMTIVLALAKSLAARTGLAWRLVMAGALAVVTLPPLVRTSTVYWHILATTPHETRPQAYAAAPDNHYRRLREIAGSVQMQDGAAVTYVFVPPSRNKEVWRGTKAPPSLQALFDEMLTLLDAPNSVAYDPATDATVAYELAQSRDLQMWRAVARSLQAELYLARAAGQTKKAVDFALAIVRLGDMLGRGALEVDALIGHGLRRVGYIELHKDLEKIPVRKHAVLIAALQQSLDQREDSAPIGVRQAYQHERVRGWHYRMEAAVNRNFDPSQDPDLERGYSHFDVMTNVLLQAELAIHSFKSDRGRFPTALEELVPQYLPSLPRDPYSPAMLARQRWLRAHPHASLPLEPDSPPLRYRLEGDGYVLYSVGWDCTDDGGKFGTFNDYWASNPAGMTLGEPPADPRPRWDFDLKTLTREPPEEAPDQLQGTTPAPPPPDID